MLWERNLDPVAATAGEVEACLVEVAGWADGGTWEGPTEMSNLVGVTPDGCRLYAGDTLCRLPGSAAGGRPRVLWGRERRRWSLGALGLQGMSAGYEQPSPTWICNRGPTETTRDGDARKEMEGTTTMVGRRVCEGERRLFFSSVRCGGGCG